MSFLAAMTSCSNLKRKILVLKKIEPLIREVVHGIPSTSTFLKKKVRKRGRTADSAFPAQDSGRERSNIAGANKRSLINLSPDETKHNILSSSS
uniref:Uncharacterized protein n=1 Tax=Cannabis sativa TaxID=3483 RepID=A0A803PCN5_CANSA